MPGAGKINFFFNAHFELKGCDGRCGSSYHQGWDWGLFLAELSLEMALSLYAGWVLQQSAVLWLMCTLVGLLEGGGEGRENWQLGERKVPNRA